MNLTSDQTVVLVCEKLSQYNNFTKAFSYIFADVEPYGVTTHAVGPSTFGMKLPRNMPVSSLPVIQEPIWDVRDQPVFHKGERLPDVSSRQLLKEADVIICATDYDVPGAHAFRNLTRHYLDDPNDAVDFPWLRCLSETPQAIAEAVALGTTTADPGFRAMVAAGDAKRFFESCWAANAIPLFAPLLRRAGAPQGKLWMSKYALQLLFFFADTGGDRTEGQVVREMSSWTGTGKYPGGRRGPGIGSAASRVAILQQLKEMGFLELGSGPQGERDWLDNFRVSDAGKRFLDLVHPKCRDADLPFRLQEWGWNWPTSRPAMETYIRTFFGRQRRFSAKTTATAG